MHEGGQERQARHLLDAAQGLAAEATFVLLKKGALSKNKLDFLQEVKIRSFFCSPSHGIRARLRPQGANKRSP